MKAFCITAPQHTEIRPRPRPEPGEDEVLLKIRYVGFCGSDLNTYRGLNPMVSYPRIPGHEVSGVIDSVGSGVTGEWQPGMAVTLSPYTACGKCPACRLGRTNCCRDNQTLGVQRDGAMTEFLAVPAAKLFASPRLDCRELALVEPLTVGGHAVERAAVTPGETVMVLGCGAIGLGAVAGAAFRGARVVAVDIDDDKLTLATAAGAAETINSREASLNESVAALTDGDGPSVVIEAIGLPQTFRAAVDLVAFAGRVVYIGYAKQAVAYETKLFVQKELDIRGSRNAMPENFDTVIRMLEARRFPVDAVLSRTVPLAEAGAALAAWDDHPAAVTKILVDMTG